MVIHLSKEMQQFVSQQVAQGGFQSADECVNNLLRQIKPKVEADASAARQQREQVLQLVEQIQQDPSPLPEDGLTGRDHDKILYDREQK